MNTRERDYRLDFCRGLALLIIFIDHVPYNSWANWTLHNYAFCDAAEVFVLISGMASYLAYGGRFDREGFWTCTKAIGRRWSRVYLAHLALFLAVGGLILAAAQHFSGADYVGSMSLSYLARSPEQALTAALTLSYLPRLLDILPLYLVLLGLAPFLIYLVKRNYWLALLVSAAVYVATWSTGFNLNAGGGRHWFFNPFAWQFLYTLGMVVCHLSRTASTVLVGRKAWLIAAIGFSVISYLIVGPLHDMGFTHAAPLSYIWPTNKTFLAPLRVLNVMALLYVFGSFVSPQASWLKTRGAELLLACGRHSLPIYGVGVVLSCIGYLVMVESSSKEVANLFVNLCGIGILVALAFALDWYGQGKRVTAPAKIVLASERSAA